MPHRDSDAARASSDRARTSCLCTGCNGSGRVGVPSVVPSSHLRQSGRDARYPSNAAAPPRSGPRSRATAMPCSWATTAACTLSRGPSLSMTLPTRMLTVASVPNNRSAVSASGSQRATSTSTSAFRAGVAARAAPALERIGARGQWRRHFGRTSTSATVSGARGYMEFDTSGPEEIAAVSDGPPAWIGATLRLRRI
jgi:hypothetical protein